MDNQMFIINPLEEINYLFEYVFHITTPTPSSMRKQEMSQQKQLEVMMQGVSLADRMQQQKMDNLLMYSPRSITDYSKFKWMEPLNPCRLMQRSTGRLNNYLNSLVYIMNDKSGQNRFEFIEMSPHSRNLAAKCNFKQGEVVL